MTIRKLILKDKFDLDTTKKLSQYSFQEIEPIIPELMEWLQDMNWPVAGIVANYLVSIADHLENEIITIFKTDDGMWKYWII